MISSVVESCWNWNFADFKDFVLILPEAATGGVLKNFAIFSGKHLCKSLLITLLAHELILFFGLRWVVRIGSVFPKQVFYRPKWTKEKTTLKWIFSKKKWMLQKVRAEKLDEKNRVICLVSMFPSCVMVRKLSKKCISCNFVLTSARNLTNLHICI